MTFAATAEVVRYQGAVPLLVDCDPVTLNMDLADAARKIADLPRRPHAAGPGTGGGRHHSRPRRRPDDRHGRGAGLCRRARPVAGGGRRPRLPGRLWRQIGSSQYAPWRRCGENTSAVACFSFYANKTMTTGEGGMAVTDDDALAARMRQMSLHGLSHDAWKRYSGNSAWDYRIVAAGFKYNLTDIAAALGICQLRRADDYAPPAGGNCPPVLPRICRPGADRTARGSRRSGPFLASVSHPAPNLDRLRIDRNRFIEEIRSRGVGCSVHWRPLHLHPYYEESFGWRPEQLPVATREWTRLISLPLFPGMRDEECGHVLEVVHSVCAAHTR